MVTTLERLGDSTGYPAGAMQWIWVDIQTADARSSSLAALGWPDELTVDLPGAGRMGDSPCELT